MYNLNFKAINCFLDRESCSSPFKVWDEIFKTGWMLIKILKSHFITYKIMSINNVMYNYEH